MIATTGLRSTRSFIGGRTAASIDAQRRLDKMASDSATDDALAELKRKLGK